MKTTKKTTKTKKGKAKDLSLFLRYDQEFDKIMSELKDLVGLENNPQLIRFAIKYLYRHKVLNYKQNS